MDFKKNMKAGYQGRRDEMREKAEKLMNHPGHAEAVYMSKSAADKDKMRPYKEGGHIKDHNKQEEKDINKEHHKKMEREEKMEKNKKNPRMKGECQKFALGGVAKIRLEEANANGTPKKFKKKSLKDVL